MLEDKLTTYDFDRIILGDKVSLFKLAIPYMDYHQQSMLAVFIRIMEFKLTLDFYKSAENFANPARKAFSLDTILKDLNNCCPPEYKSMLNNINMLMNMSQYMDLFNKTDDIMSAFKNFTAQTPKPDTRSQDNTQTNSTPNSSPINLLKGMLTKEQQDMLNTYSELLNN